MSKNGRTLRGVKVAHCKNTEELTPVAMPTPSKVFISMHQHIGAPCTPLVAKGDTVKVGQVIGNTEAYVSAPVHASVSGTVAGIEQIVSSNGAADTVVVIESDGANTVDESIAPPKVESYQDFTAALRASGLVGLGGAGFPAHVKFSPKNLDAVDTLIVNGAECEPYITSDYRTAMDHTEDVLEGIKAVQKYLNIGKAYVVFESNKPKAISKFQEMTKDDSSVEVVSLDAKYPKGAEKVIVYETTGRVVGEGKLPMDVGVIVSNITSVAFIAQYLRTGMPLVSKCVTVDGSAVKEPKNVIAPIGTPYRDIIDFCGGYSQECRKLIMGGPMMGIAVYSDSYPLLKNNNAILAMGEKEANLGEETACIRCGNCLRACPFNLAPAAIERAFKTKNLDSLRALKVNLCMECGCCAYSCPAKRHLVLTNKMAKQMIAEKK